MSQINEETRKGEMKQMSTRKHWPGPSSSSLSEDEKASILLVLSIGRAFKSVDEYVRPRMRLLGLTMTEFSVLTVLYHNGDTPLGQLSQRILLTGASTTYRALPIRSRSLNSAGSGCALLSWQIIESSWAV